VDLTAELALWVAGWVLATLVCTALARGFDARQHPLRAPVRFVRSAVLPLALAYVLARRGLGWSFEPPVAATPLRVLETLLWLAGIVAAVSIATHTATVRREGTQYATRYPKLLLDLLRLILVLVGTCFVVAGVWNYELGSLLTAVGISSIVLGLALQNTLDNVMAGIAVLFERPFHVGDWVTIGALTGEVMEMNWRSVRIRTRERDLFVVPNSVVGKETLVNLSRPTRAHVETHTLGFSYDDAPNKVKRVLLEVVHATRGALASPPPEVLTRKYADWAIEYEVRYYIDDYERQLTINDEFMTRVWYAAKRHGLTIPFPTQVEIGIEPPAKADPRDHAATLAAIPVFVPLSPAELDELAMLCPRQGFGAGERVVRQGNDGDTMFVIVEGTAVVTVDAPGGAPADEREVAQLHRGDFFGEMALLTGEARTANVTALDDLVVVVVGKAALQTMFGKRPALAHEIAEIVATRRQGLKAVQDAPSAAMPAAAAAPRAATELLQRIRRFFGL
jgi:small-conductance mechanosensitive channel/CRP-like cAMP-binding protein